MAFGLGNCYQAGANRLAVEQHRARAAIPGVTTNLGAREVEVLAQDSRKPLPGQGRNCDRGSIHGEGQGALQIAEDSSRRQHVIRLPRKQRWHAAPWLTRRLGDKLQWPARHRWET